MNNGKDLAKIIQNFLEERKGNNLKLNSANSNESLPSRQSKETNYKIKELQAEVRFWSHAAQTYLENLQRLEAESDSKDLTIQELKTTIQQLKEKLDEILKKKDKQIATLTNQQRFLNDLLGTKVDWRSKRHNFVRILTTNLPINRIKAELGDIQHGWEDDVVLQVLTERDKQKIKIYDELEVKHLPKDWKEQLRNLKEKLEKIKGLRRPRIGKLE